MMTDKFGLGSSHEARQTMNGDIDDGHAPLFISTEEESTVSKRNKTVHNSTEKKRKEQIRYWIQQIGEQLPPLVTTKSEKERHGRSTLEIVEKACTYIKELKGKIGNDEELQKVSMELENMRAERDRLQEILKMAGYAATQEVPPQGTSVPAPEATAEQEKKKTKKRNTINLQLELKKQQAAAAQQQQQQQETQQQQNAALATGAAGMQDVLAQGIMGNPMTNFPNMMIGGAGQQLINQQMFMNSMMFGVPPAGGSQMPMGGLPGQTMTGQQSDKNAAEAGAGLLQLAMQDAGITPSSNNSAPQTEDSVSTSAAVQRSSAADQSTVSSALHTLASVASNTQNVTNVSQIPASQVQSNASMIQTGATTTTTQSVNSVAPIMATGQQNLNGTNSVMNMPFVNGQQQMATNVMPGNQIVNPGTSNAMQQIMFINEQGVPCIANVPVGIDPASLGLPNMGKQIVSGNLLIQKDDQQTVLANNLAQQQMNLAMQGIQQQTFQQGQTNVTMGGNNIVQQPVNNQLALNQHIMQPMQGPIQGLSNPQNPQGLILPASQTGNLLTVNSVPNFSNPQSQLPQALLLPNGQIIPVVSNPNLFAPGQAPANQLITPGGQPNAIQQGAGIPQRLPVPQNIVQPDGSQMLVTSTGQIQVAPQNMNIQGQATVQQGLLMTTNSILPQVSPSTSSTASGTTSLVSTSVVTSTVTSTSGVTVNRKPKTSVSATSSAEEVIMTQNQANLVQTGLDSSTPVTSQVMTSDPNSASMKILNPQLQSVLHGQLGGSTAPILLTMNCNGQPTSILVDPTTMQVLGTVQTQQPPQQPNLNPATSVSTSTPSKKSKKNGQRAICPKPQVANTSSAITTVTSVINPIVGPTVTLPTQANPSIGAGVWTSDKESMEVLPPLSAPPSKKSSSKSKSKSKSNKGNTETQLEAQGKTDGDEMGEQDILAKAAESIFSEISPVNFYNPANEDNPLQIDTSVCEGEEEGKESESPKKDANKGKVSSAGATDNSLVLDSEMMESNTEDVKNKSKKDFSDSLKEQSPDENDILTNILKAAESNEQEKASETGNNDSNNQVGESLFDIVSNTAVETAKKSKKSKKSKMGNNTAEISDSSSKDSPALISLEDKPTTQSSKKSSKKSKKTEQENSLKESVVEQESLMSMPEEITFCENDIEDVLNQVEKMGNSFGSPTNSVSKKSSKSKKDRSENVDSEPANKRRKRNVSKEKSKEAGEPTLQASTASKSSMSVYDFDEDTDFSTPLFPLHSSRNLSGGANAKNQTASSSSDKTPTSSSSPLFSMPVITTEPGSTTTPLFDDFPMTPKKRGKHKKNKKVEEKISDVTVSKKSDNDLLNSNSLDRLGSESRTDSDKNTTSDVTKKNSENCLEKMDVQYSSKDNGFLSKTDTRQHSVNFPSEQSNNKNSSSLSFESQGNTEQQMSMTTQNMDSSRQDRMEGNLNSRRPVTSRSNVDQMSVDTNPLTVDTNDIESTVSNLLGLSPHMLSPSNMRHKQVQQSPQLQTPKSNSPASMKSPMTSPAITYQQQTHMSNDHLTRPSAPSSISTNPDLTYSAESLFSSQSKHLDSSRGMDTNSSQLQPTTRMSGNTDSMMKPTEESSSAARPKSIYSADNFVHSAKNDKSSKSAPNVISPSMSTSLPRGQNENSSDGFNFNNIGLNLSTPTTSTNSFMDSLTMSPIISTVANTTSSSTPFTFTLSSNSSTHTTSTASMMQSPASQSQNSSHQGNHNFPFYSPHQSPQRPPSHHQRPPTTSASPQHTNSAPSNISSNQSQRPPVNNLSNFDLNLPPSNSQMPSSQPSQRRSSHEHDARMSQHMPTMTDSQYPYGMSRNCSVQDQRQREQTTMPREEPPSFPNITVTTHEGPLNMGMSKSNPHKRLNDIAQGSMSSKSASDSRSDRTSGGGYSMNSSMQPFFPPPNFSNSSSNPLETPPLHHPPMLGSDNRGSMGVRGFNPVFSSSQSYNPVQQSFGGNRYESNNVPPFSQRDSAGTQPLSHTPPNQVMDGRKSANTPSSQTAKSNKQPSQPMQGSQTNRTMNGPPSHRSGPTPPQAPPQASHRPTPQQQLSQPQSQQSRSKSSSSSSRSSSSKQSQKKKQNYVEMESGIPPHPAMFEANRMTPLFPLPQARSPPFPANLFGSGPHQGASMSKNSELSSPFNQLFPPARPQNGLGFQFNNFGMNSVHSAMSNSPQITPHSGSVTVTPHMSNFTFTNIFSDVNNSSQNDALNISPIKFPHPNPMLPHQGMDPNSLHHPHQQGSSIYHHHNRAHPSSVIHNAMNINSILGHNHHSFDSRGMSQGMNTSVAPPFAGHGHPPGFGMPPLNFSMHDT